MHPSPTLPQSVVQCQNQEIDIGTICRAYSDFASYICTHLCVSVFVGVYFSAISS